MSAFIDIVKKRYSVRSYQSRPVEETVLLKILEAACLAPSACNNQPLAIVVVQKEEDRKALIASYERQWLAQVPVILALCCDTSQTWRRADGKNFGDIDVAIAMDHLTLAAAEAGLGTCWIGNFDACLAEGSA